MDKDNINGIVAFFVASMEIYVQVFLANHAISEMQ